MSDEYDPKSRLDGKSVDDPNLAVCRVEVADLVYDCHMVANVWLRDSELIENEIEVSDTVIAWTSKDGKLVKLNIFNSIKLEVLDDLIEDRNERHLVKCSIPAGFVAMETVDVVEKGEESGDEVE